MGKIILTIGLVGLCHAAYSATQHRSYMRLTEHEQDSSKLSQLPIDILVQTILCLFLSCFGVINIAAKFRPIKITSEWENKTWDNIANRTSFYSFNHRGKYLFSSGFDHFDKELFSEEIKNLKVRRQLEKRPQQTQEQKEETSSSETNSEESDYDERTNQN